MKCKYGFYTCSFIGQVNFCNTCDEGQNYQMKQEIRGGARKGAGRKKIFNDPVILNFKCELSDKLKAKSIYGAGLNKLFNEWLKKIAENKYVE